jgi:hypothetical protein
MARCMFPFPEAFMTSPNPQHVFKPEVLEALRKQRTHRDIDETHEEMILCPECESQYNHILRVGTELGTDEHEAEIYHKSFRQGTVCFS